MPGCGRTGPDPPSAQPDPPLPRFRSHPRPLPQRGVGERSLPSSGRGRRPLDPSFGQRPGERAGHRCSSGSAGAASPVGEGPSVSSGPAARAARDPVTWGPRCRLTGLSLRPRRARGSRHSCLGLLVAPASPRGRLALEDGRVVAQHHAGDRESKYAIAGSSEGKLTSVCILVHVPIANW